MFYVICLWLFLHISLYNSTTLHPPRCCCHFQPSCLPWRGTAIFGWPGGTEPAERGIWSQKCRSTLNASPGPNEWYATYRSLIHRFFFETPNTLTEGCKWIFFVRTCVFFRHLSTNLQELYAEENSTIQLYTCLCDYFSVSFPLAEQTCIQQALPKGFMHFAFALLNCCGW